MGTAVEIAKVQRRSLSRTALLSAQPDAQLSSIAGLSARATSADSAIAIVAAPMSRAWVGHVGLPVDSQAASSSSIWTLCRAVVETAKPMNVAGFAGVPIVTDAGLGAVCVAHEGRVFTEGDVAALQLAARLAEGRLASAIRERPPPLIMRPDGRTSLDVGDVVDEKYEITARLGEGGEATVYLARDARVGQMVALKVQRASADPAILREASALAALHHPSIVQLYGWGQLPSGAVYLVLEHVNGVTLHQYLAELRRADERLSVSRILESSRALAGGLATLHAAGRLHGDVQPANIMIDRVLDRPVLIDFGLGTKLDGVSRARGGTPGWSAPEQLDSADGVIAWPGLDAYGLATVTYAMLTGRAPFTGTRDVQVAAQLGGAIPSLRGMRAELSEQVDIVFEHALAGNPVARYPSAIAFVDALEIACGIRPSLWASRETMPSMPMTHSRAFINVRQGVARVVGKAAEAKIFESVSAHTRAVFEQAQAHDGSYPSDCYVEYMEAFAKGDLSRVELLGRFVAGLTVPQEFRDMRVAHTPEALLLVSAELLHRFHDWGNIRVTRASAQSVSLELEMPARFAPTMCHFLMAVLGALIKGMGRQVTVTKMCCIARGASACRYDVSWT